MPGKLFIISAPSGAGKTTLCKILLEKVENLKFSISYTTRNPRQNEQNGVDYFFISQEEFRLGIANNQWAEWAEVHGNFYATSNKFLQSAIYKGFNVLLDIDVQGAKKITKIYPESITIFIMPPSLEELENRLKSRGKDDLQTIQKRLKNAQNEIAQKDFYKHVIINDLIDKASQELIRIIKI